jgi:hypothetical protein
MGKFLLRRLREPSTWAGIVTVITALAGWQLDDAQRDAIVLAGTSLVGLLLVFTKESGDVEQRASEELRRAIREAGDRAYRADPGDDELQQPASALRPDRTNPAASAKADQRKPRRWPFGRRNV